MPNLCTLTGEVLNIAGTERARVGTRVTVRRVRGADFAHSTSPLDFYVNEDGELKTAAHGPAQVPQGAYVTFEGSVEGFSRPVEVVIPAQAEYDFRLLLPAVSVTVAGVTTGQLQTEATTRSAADSALQANINAEALRAQAAEGALVPKTTTVNGHTLSGNVTVTKGDVGLGNADNTSDANKPVSAATQAALDLKAPLASPALTGTPAAPTAAPGTNTTQIATTAFVQAVKDAIVNGAPGALDTLIELSAALGNDANFSTTVTNALAAKQPLDSDLTAIGALTPANDDIIQRKAGVWTNRTLAQFRADLNNLGTFNVKDYGAVGDNSANDVAAFRLAISTINAAGGGTLIVPAGTYLFSVGDPASDTNYTTINSTYKVLLNPTANNIKIQLDRKATIRVVASFIYQNNAGATTSITQTLFYFGTGTTTPISGFELTGGRITWETGGSAALYEVTNGTNAFEFHNGYIRDSVFRDVTVDGFPRGGTLTGYTSGSIKRTDCLFDNYRVTNYGGSGHDNWLYVQGGNTFQNCSIISTRTYQSHGLYWGGDRPYNTVRGCYFKGIGSAANANKYAIHLINSSDNDITDVRITHNIFDVYLPILIQHSTLNARRIQIEGNIFIGPADYLNPAVDAYRLYESRIVNNSFKDFGTAVVVRGGVGIQVNGNAFQKVTAAVSVSNTTPKALGVSVDNNTFYDGQGATTGVLYSGLGGSVSGNRFVNWFSSAGAVGISVSTDDVALRGNTFYNSTGLTVGQVITVSGNNNVIEGNVSDGPATSFVYVQGTATNTTVQNNRATNGMIWTASTTTGPTLVSGNITGGALRAQGPDTIIKGNVFSLLDTPVSTQQTGAVLGMGNYIGSVEDTESPSYAASYTPHAGVYRTAQMTLTGNVTVNAPTNPRRGQLLSLIFTQDATGGRTVTWDVAFKVNWTPDTTANKVNTITFRYNGTNWVQVSAATGL